VSDSNLAAVSNNEFVVNAAATRRNLNLLQHINAGGDTAGPPARMPAAAAAYAPPVTLHANISLSVAGTQLRIAQQQLTLRYNKFNPTNGQNIAVGRSAA
jgi:hypothetical protein